ncbi:MAG: ATP-dependent helicase HrpB [Candidatus Sumerlaeia bacterium]|nr:ATP-dependent helicase HrpB [Candidatus Sumerlaeia bacterium]
MTPLPIDPLIPEIVASLEAVPNLVLLAPPGAGKTTRVPPGLINATWLGKSNRRIVMLQPRRVATRAAAMRIASEQGWAPGAEVGWHIRFEKKSGPRTRIEVITEGILSRRIQNDPFLEGIGCVILDEFHERNIHSDVALALLREIQGTVRPDLRVIVMSATMDPIPVSRFLGEAPILKAEGRPFPVDIQYLERPTRQPCWELAAAAVRDLIQMRLDGDILVFLPGMGEIRKTARLLEDLDMELPILHSSVSGEQQDRALLPAARRKVVLATNIAETSITIDGIRAVIDTGLARVLVNNPRLGLDRLEMRRISKNSATQRAGRAGRTGPGSCIRLWTQQEHHAMEESDPPELHRVDLASTVLLLKEYGVTNPETFEWFEPPPPGAIQRASSLLQLIGAIDGAGALTDRGRLLARLPVHPRLGVLLMAGARGGYTRDAAMIAALLSERDILHSSSRGSGVAATECDLMARLDMINEGSRQLDEGAVRAVRRVAADLERLVEPMENAGSPALPKSEALRRALLAAFPDRVVATRPDDPRRGVMVGGRGVRLEAESGIHGGRFFLALELRDPPGGGGEARVNTASCIDASWIGEVHPEHLESTVVHRVDPEAGKVSSRRQSLFLGLVLGEAAIPGTEDPDGVSKALCSHLAANIEELVLNNKTVAPWVQRVRFLSRALPGEGWPGYTREELVDVLGEACLGCRTVREVEGNLMQALRARLGWKLAAELDDLAPESIAVPSGSRIKLKYGEPGAEAPILAARLQELFGMEDTPRIARGKVAVLLHLLGPNYRPVQVTRDLRNFWNTTYTEVRKELRARYPKHPWPEDPWKADAVAVGRRRR